MEPLTKAKEDYLEAILMIRNEKGHCLSVDISHKLGVSKPSVSAAVKSLESSGHLYRSDNDIRLTTTGRSIAENILNRHMLLTEILSGIGVSLQTAEHDACLIEHHLSEETYNRIKTCWNGTKATA